MRIWSEREERYIDFNSVEFFSVSKHFTACVSRSFRLGLLYGRNRLHIIHRHCKYSIFWVIDWFIVCISINPFCYYLTIPEVDVVTSWVTNKSRPWHKHREWNSILHPFHEVRIFNRNRWKLKCQSDKSHTTTTSSRFCIIQFSKIHCRVQTDRQCLEINTYFVLPRIIPIPEFWVRI